MSTWSNLQQHTLYPHSNEFYYCFRLIMLVTMFVTFCFFFVFFVNVFVSNKENVYNCRHETFLWNGSGLTTLTL